MCGLSHRSKAQFSQSKPYMPLISYLRIPKHQNRFMEVWGQPIYAWEKQGTRNRRFWLYQQVVARIPQENNSLSLILLLLLVLWFLFILSWTKYLYLGCNNFLLWQYFDFKFCGSFWIILRCLLNLALNFILLNQLYAC